MAAESVPWTLSMIGGAKSEMQTGASASDVILSGSANATKALAGDTCLFAGKSIRGDSLITARVVEITDKARNNLVGIALRDGNASGGVRALLAKNPADDWFTMRWRPAPGQNLKAIDTFTGNGKGIKYLRLERQGDKITGLRSADGVFWFKVSEQRIPGLPESLQLGVFVSNVDNPSAFKATFSDLEVSSAQPDQAVRFQKIMPDTPSLAPFYGPLRLNPRQLQPASDKNPRGYASAAPWKGVYKNPEPLIPDLDIPGPDGLIYPDFRHAGVQGGIPSGLPVVVTIPVGTADFAADLEKAIAGAGGKGGVIQLEAGTYTLKRPLIIERDGIVLRGKGPAADTGTTIRFEYGLEPKQIRWFNPTAPAPARTIIGLNDLIEVQSDLDSPADGAKGTSATLILKIDGKQVRQIKWAADETGRFRVMMLGSSARNEGFASGDHTLTAEVTWKDGSTSSDSRLITLSGKDSAKAKDIGADAAIQFAGRAGAPVPLANPLPRGATSMKAIAGLNLKPGDYLLIHAGPSDAWVKRVKAVPPSEGGSSYFRHAIVRIKSATAAVVTFNQPLRIDFEASKYSWVKKLDMVQGSGVEDLALEQPQKIWTHGIYMTNAANCWVKNVRMEKAGRNAFWTNTVKWIEARDIEIHDAWFKGGGGTAYVGWEGAADCLMDGVKSSLLRHGPNMQWSSNGCVIRNGDFSDSDAQFHAGWPYENLVENCTIRSVLGNGSYGYGFFIVGPESHIHGPMGPRNVLFNNDIGSHMAGLWFGGSDEAYKVLYNRVTVEDGPAVLLKNGAFDHTFLGNVFITKKPVPAAVLIVTPDCTGIDFVRNKFYGVEQNSAVLRPFIFAGAIPPAVDKENEFLPYTNTAPRPTPAVPSLFEWQRSLK